MNPEGLHREGGGREGRGDAGGGVGRVDADELIQKLESEEIREQFFKKKKALGELKGNLNQHSEEEMELRSLSSTNQV